MAERQNLIATAGFYDYVHYINEKSRQGREGGTFLMCLLT